MKRLLILVTLTLVACEPLPESSAPTLKMGETVTVARVIDGDTFVDTNKVTYRPIGVDTPETNTDPDECYGPEATEYLRSVLPKGTQVRIVLDSRNGTKPDRYGRTLAYVFKGSEFVNLELVAQGYGVKDEYDNTRDHRDAFRAAEAAAKAERRGLWGAC